MARLSDLPNEIILAIIPLILPNDIESFASTCKKIYNLAAEELERHRALKRKYALYRFCDRSGSSQFFPWQLLDMVLRKPRTAFYVQEMSIKSVEWWTGNLNMLQPKDAVSRRRKAISKLVPEDEVPMWLSSIESGSLDPNISLLLLLLPNLSTVRFEYSFVGDQACLHGTLSRIAEMKCPGAPLSRLRHVQIRNPKDNTGLDLVGLFAALPSVRSIHGWGIKAFNFDANSDTDTAPRTSNLEDLVLAECSINPKRLYLFLETFKALRSFAYSDDPLLRDYSYDTTAEFDPFWIRSGLYAFARPSLDSLTILSQDAELKFMGDIRSFEAIRTLRLETQLLLRESHYCHDETSLAKALPPNLEN